MKKCINIALLDKMTIAEVKIQDEDTLETWTLTDEMPKDAFVYGRFNPIYSLKLAAKCATFFDANFDKVLAGVNDAANKLSRARNLFRTNPYSLVAQCDFIEKAAMQIRAIEGHEATWVLYLSVLRWTKYWMEGIEPSDYECVINDATMRLHSIKTLEARVQDRSKERESVKKSKKGKEAQKDARA